MAAASNRDWSDVGRVLAIRLDSIGDVLMTTPALRAVKQAGCHITLLTSPAGAAVAPLIPEIDETITYVAPWMKAGAEMTVENDHEIVKALEAGWFDAAIVFTVFSQTPFPSAMLARLAGIPRVLMHSRERAYGLASNEVTETEPEQGIRHEVQRQLDLVATLGWRPTHDRLSLTPPPEARKRAATLAPTGPWAIIHPGSTAPSRRWPPDYFAETAARLAERGWRIVYTGDGSERELCEQVATRSGVDALNLAGTLDLATLAALIGEAPLLITNNSGPAHIASAMGTPVVDIYALTNPQHTPWAVRHAVLSHDVECRWCYSSVCKAGHHMCLRGVSPQQVIDAAMDITSFQSRAAA